MRKLFAIYFFSLSLLVSCNKTGSNSGNGSGNTGNTGADLKVTSFSPVNPYTDDQLTIIGTGFNPDKTLDTVIFNFQPAIITDATTTQLKLQFPPEANMNMSVCYCSSFDVRANGKKFTVAGGINFTRFCKLYGLTDADNSNQPVGRPADSLVINGSGFSLSGCAFTVDGHVLDHIKIDSAYQCKATLRLPKGIFGENNDESIMQTKTVTVTNSAGKTDQKDLNFFISPVMKINDLHAENNSYSLSGLTGSGGSVKVFVTGANLKSDASVHLDSNTGIHTQSGLTGSGFPDSTTLEFSSSGLIQGSYQVSIWRNGTLYGGCNFTVNP